MHCRQLIWATPERYRKVEASLRLRCLTSTESGAGLRGLGYSPTRIWRWADAHANLPSRARWIAQADVASSWAKIRELRRPSQFDISEGFVLFKSIIGSGLVQAYRETDYKVHGDEPFTLKVEAASPALATAHKRYGVNCSAYITAWNPLGIDQAIAVNTQRNAELAAQLARLSLASVEGIGQHPTSQQPGEASYLIFGLSLEAAKTLGTKWAQNAIVWSGANAVPQLIMLR